MSFGKKFGIQAAMEELDEAAGEVAVTDEVVEMPADEETVETAMAEVTEASADVEGGTDSIEEAVGDAETLADVADKMEDTAETGGMDEKAAAIAEVAVEALYERLHVTRRKAMPALESFGSQSSRLKATTIAVEEIRETLKKTWAAIIAMAQKVVEFVKGFFMSIFDTSTKLREKAAKLQKAVDSVKGTPESAKLEGTKLGEQLSMDGKVSVEGLEKAVKNLVAAAGQTDSFVKQAEDMAGSDFIQFIKDPKRFDEAKPIMDKPANMEVDDAGTYGKAPEGTVAFVSGELVGNRVLKTVYPAGGVTGAAAWTALANVSVSVETFDEKQKAVESVSVLTADEMKKVLAQVLELVDGIDKLKPAVAAAEAATSKVVAAARKAAVLNIAEDKEAFARGRAVSKAVSKMASVVTRPGTLLSKLMVETAKAELDWVVKSGAQYKGGAAALPAPKKDELSADLDKKKADKEGEAAAA